MFSDIIASICTEFKIRNVCVRIILSTNCKILSEANEFGFLMFLMDILVLIPTALCFILRM